MEVQQIIDTEKHPVLDQEFRAKCKVTLDQTGVLILREFLRAPAIATIYQEALDGREKAYFCTQSHNVYLMEANPSFASDHPRNRHFATCITLKILNFFCALFWERKRYMNMQIRCRQSIYTTPNRVKNWVGILIIHRSQSL